MQCLLMQPNLYKLPDSTSYDIILQLSDSVFGLISLPKCWSELSSRINLKWETTIQLSILSKQSEWILVFYMLH